MELGGGGKAGGLALGPTQRFMASINGQLIPPTPGFKNFELRVTA